MGSRLGLQWPGRRALSRPQTAVQGPDPRGSCPAARSPWSPRGRGTLSPRRWAAWGIPKARRGRQSGLGRRVCGAGAVRGNVGRQGAAGGSQAGQLSGHFRGMGWLGPQACMVCDPEAGTGCLPRLGCGSSPAAQCRTFWSLLQLQPVGQGAGRPCLPRSSLPQGQQGKATPTCTLPSPRRSLPGPGLENRDQQMRRRQKL